MNDMRQIRYYKNSVGGPWCKQKNLSLIFFKIFYKHDTFRQNKQHVVC